MRVQNNRESAAVMVGAILMLLASAISLPAQTLTTIFSFDDTDGYRPYGPLVQGADGNFYGRPLGAGPTATVPYSKSPQGEG